MIPATDTKEIRDRWIGIINHLQENICKAIEEMDGKALFKEDKWKRTEGESGGGLTKVIEKGNVFEKGGVNTAVVFGQVTDNMRKHLGIAGSKWFAAGLSVVIHPVNPFVPTVHCNYRMFELFNEEDTLIDRWFGGGTDLTPYYLFEEDAKYFHQSCKNVCDQFDPLYYPAFKNDCDNYFVNTHRQDERRGIGGIFYDHQRPDNNHTTESWMDFGKACAETFITAYLQIVRKRKDTLYTTGHKHWQEIRRGRYVEFNLVHDKGTLFGLKTNGRIESILMSLPPTVRFEYDYKPEPGSEEDKLLQVCLHPKDWV